MRGTDPTAEGAPPRAGGVVEGHLRGQRRLSTLLLVLIPATALWGTAAPAWLVVVHWLALAAFVAARLGAHESLARPHLRRPATVGLLLATGLLYVSFASSSLLGEPTWPWVLALGAVAADLDGHLNGPGRRGRRRQRGAVVVTLAGAALVAVAFAHRANAVAATLADVVFPLIGIPAVAYIESVDTRLWRRQLSADRARDEAARAQVLQERLRIADDLHDILGNALEQVSFRAELAARLLHRDPDAAAEELSRVQDLARTATRDVRDVARSTRPTDLAAEIGNAKELFDAAGIDCRLDLARIPPPVSELFGRIVKEATTNMLRHANVSWCRYVVRHQDDDIVLEIVNDGVVDGQPRPDSSGTAALRRRVERMGGSLVTRHDARNATFTVVTYVPAPAVDDGG